MLKRNLIIIAILTIAFALTSNVFGQNTKGKTTKNVRITKRPNQATGGTIPVYWGTKRKITPVKNSFESQTQPFADGRSKRNQRKGVSEWTDILAKSSNKRKPNRRK